MRIECHKNNYLFHNCAIFYQRKRTFSIEVAADRGAIKKRFFFHRCDDAIYKLLYNLLLFAASIDDPIELERLWGCYHDFDTYLISTIPFPFALAISTETLVLSLDLLACIALAVYTIYINLIEQIRQTWIRLGSEYVRQTKKMMYLLPEIFLILIYRR